MNCILFKIVLKIQKSKPKELLNGQGFYPNKEEPV